MQRASNGDREAVALGPGVVSGHHHVKRKLPSLHVRLLQSQRIDRDHVLCLMLGYLPQLIQTFNGSWAVMWLPDGAPLLKKRLEPLLKRKMLKRSLPRDVTLSQGVRNRPLRPLE